jgi:hypothetical protein
VAHAYLAVGDYEQAIATNVEDQPVLTAYALDALGRTGEAVALLQEVDKQTLPKLYRLYVRGTLRVFEGNRAEALESFQTLFAGTSMRDPCGWYYAARSLAYVGQQEPALVCLQRSVSGGFFCFPWLTRDPWIDSVRHRPEFRTVLADAETRHRHAADAFLRAGGDRLLGSVGT